MPFNNEKISHASKWKYNKEHENQVTLLMIFDGNKWHYFVVKSLSPLLIAITSKHDWDFCCLNCFYSYSTKDKLKKHENICKNHDYCYVEMPNEDNKMLKYNHGENPIKLPFIIYVELNSLLEKISTCYNNPEKSK